MNLSSQLAALRQRAARATPGPWKVEMDSDYNEMSETSHVFPCAITPIITTFEGDMKMADADFISRRLRRGLRP